MSTMPRSEAEFVRELDRRLGLLARELGALLEGGGTASDLANEVGEILGSVRELGERLTADAPTGDWTATRGALVGEWQELRRRFEASAQRADRQFRSERGVDRGGPHW